MKRSPHISSFSIIVAFVSVALAGLALIPLLPVKLSPSKNLPRMSISFTMPGNSARIIEMEVTSKLESMLSRIDGLKKINSTSDNGSGRIFIELDKHTPIEHARFEASTIIRQTWPQLPKGVSYPQLHISRPDEHKQRPFMNYTINASVAPITLQQYTENFIKPRLAQLNGIYKIDVNGATPMEWKLSYNPEQLEQLGIYLSDIQTAIQNYYSSEFIGLVKTSYEHNNQEWIRLSIIPNGNSDEFKPHLIPIKKQNGKVIMLNELVTVAHLPEEPTGYFRINGLNSIYLSISANEDANQLTLSKKIKEIITEVKKQIPTGYEIHLSYDATEYINTELNKIYFRTSLTVLILLLFVLIVSHNFKYLLLIIFSLTVNIAISFIFYYLFKLEIQMYSLTGITISLSLIIDNTIIMTDHMINKRNRGIFLPILAATLTTVGALTIIFFLDEATRLNLQDFAAVVIINLAVSLAIALLFVPALINKMSIGKKNPKIYLKNKSPKRILIYLNRIYKKIIILLGKKKWITYSVVMLIFGLPIFLLPEKIEKESSLAQIYNQTFGSSTYKEKIKPIVDKALGGTLRLFIEKVYTGSYRTMNEEVVLTITASMPNGTTLEQMNKLIMRMESYLSQFPEIRQFQTQVNSPRRASIQVYFTKEVERGSFPYQLKSSVISHALELGGGSWGVYGLKDQGFSNDTRETSGSYRIKLYGYNYDDLSIYADTLKNRLLSYRRIKEVIINSEFSWYKDDYHEFYFDLNKQAMATAGISPYQLFSSIIPRFTKNMYVANIAINHEIESIRLNANQNKLSDIWGTRYNLNPIQPNTYYRLDELAQIVKRQTPQRVAKENQEYLLCLQYEYIGARSQGERILKRELETLNKQLPMGYRAEKEDSWYWYSKKNIKQYLLLLLIAVIIFFTTGILFNSIKRPFTIICLIPISFIGVFTTFYIFKLNFDQGGFASFILLCGLTVNATIYILSEYKNIRRNRPNLSHVDAYIKAWNTKIVPISLTILSTILGFIPFMVGTQKEGFWFPLAAGIIGGLIASLLSLYFLLPLMTLKKSQIH